MGGSILGAAATGTAAGGNDAGVRGVALVRAAADEIIRRVDVPALGTPRRFRAPQPLPREGRIAGTVHLPAGPTAGAVSAVLVTVQLGLGDRVRVDGRQPHLQGRLAVVL